MKKPQIAQIFVNENLNLPRIQVELLGQNIIALCDSGASVNIIDEAILPKNTKTYPCMTQLKTINDTININRKVKLKVIINNCRFEIQCFVSPTTISENFQLILGNEFFTDNKVNINYQDQTLQFDNHVIKWVQESGTDNSKNLNLIKGYLSKKITIPPLSQQLVFVNIRKDTQPGLFLAEPSHNDFQFFVARSVVNIKEKTKIPVLLLNTNNFDIAINKNCNLVDFSVIISSDNNESCFNIMSQDEIGDLDETDLNFKQTFDLEHLDEPVKDKLITFLNNNKSIFAKSVKNMPGCSTLTHQIPLNDNIPVKKRPYRVPYNLRKEMDDQLNILLEAGILEPSTSPYSSPVLLVKKNNGEYRLVTDFRALNAKVVPDAYPIPNITEAVDNLANNKIFSSLDLISGFHQQIVDPVDRHKLAITTHRGLFQYTRTPFGLRTSANSFQRLMNVVLSGLEPLNVGIYIDDIIIASQNVDDHFPKLQAVFDRLKQHNLKLKPTKCKFLTDTVHYLGFVIKKGKVFPDQRNTNIIKNFPIPKCAKDVQKFLGSVNYYRKFISNISDRSVNLTNLTKKKTIFKWSDEAQKEFEDLKEALCNDPFLKLPDMEKDFVLYTDASAVAIGAVLCQMEDNFPRPVAFGSRKLSPPETRYSTTEREALAIVYFTNYFRQYLLGKKFLIYTDHAPLTSSLKIKDSFCRIARWALSLSQFNYDIRYLPGKINSIADFLSRNVGEAQCIKSHLFMIETTLLFPDLTLEELREKQEEDEFCKKIKLEIQSNTSKSKKFKFFLDNNILMCKLKHKSEQEDNKFVIPNSLIGNVLEIYHDSTMVCHQGIHKTIKRIKKLFFWPKLNKHVTNWIKSCKSCLERKAHQPKHLAPFQQVPSPEGPFENIYFDVVGPLPVTENGNRYIITFTDNFTKWLEAFPVASMESETIAKILMEFISHFGTPRKLYSDRGSNLISKGMEKIYDSLGIKKINITPFRPQGNVVERTHKTIANFLTHLVNNSHNNWDDKLPYALLAYRTAIHETTNFTPALLTFGREFNLPRQLIETPVKFTYNDSIDYADNLINRFKVIYNEAKENFDQAALDRQARRQKVAKPQNLKINDKVFWFNPSIKAGQCKKFAKLNQGPFIITKFFSPVSVQIQHVTRQNYHRIVHVENLSKFPDRMSFEKKVDEVVQPVVQIETKSEEKDDLRVNYPNHVFKFGPENNSLPYFNTEGLVELNTPHYNLRPRVDGRVRR